MPSFAQHPFSPAYSDVTRCKATTSGTYAGGLEARKRPVNHDVWNTQYTVAATAKWWSTAAVVVRGKYITDVFCTDVASYGTYITVLRHLFKIILLNVPFTAQNLLVNSALQSGWSKTKVSLVRKEVSDMLAGYENSQKWWNFSTSPVCVKFFCPVL